MKMSLNPDLWIWKYICPTGLSPWLPNEKSLAPCHSKICWQLPMLTAFPLTSAYFFGNQTVLVRRNKTQSCSISLRIFIAFLMVFLNIYQMFEMILNGITIWPIDILLCGFQIFAWALHIGFLFALRHRGDLSHRGPLFILVTWMALALLSCVWIRTKIILKSDLVEDAIILVLHCIYGISLIANGKSTFAQRPEVSTDERESLIGSTYVRFHDDIQIEPLGPAHDGAPWLSKLLFYWVNPLIDKGISGNLKRIDDLFELPETLSLGKTVEPLQTAITQTASLFRSLHRVFGIEFYLVGLLRFIGDLVYFAGPLLLAGLLHNEKSNEAVDDNDLRAYAYAFGLFAASIIETFFGVHFTWKISLVALKMRMSIMTAIYRKSLTAQFVNNNTPEVLNLMSTDTGRLVNSCMSFHTFWSIPFQLFVTLYLLYTQIGAAFISGVVFAVILIPINRWLANKISSLSTELLDAKDARVSQMCEVLSGAKQIKTLAWEDVFIERIDELRKKELKALSKRKYLDALCVYFWATTPVIINLLTFGTAALIATPMTAATTFASFALLNKLIGPLNSFPWIMNGLVEAYISLKRVQNYLDLPDLDLRKYYSPFSGKSSNNEDTYKRQVVISLKNASFVHHSIESEMDDYNPNFILNSVYGDIKKGDLVCVEGSVGSGKSAFLDAISGNMNRISGHIHLLNVDQGMAYVTQKTWLQHGTMRENILWGEMYDESRYRKVIWACALHKDIEDLGGDCIDIGENGSAMSGGQKARISLARAVYQDKPIYLIDDVLAALDAHVAKHIVKHCILGILKDKTRIVVTENQTLFYYSNQILHIENGSVTTSDFALGSFESENIDTSSASSDELSSPISFDLCADDYSQKEKSMFEEIKETGSISSQVLSEYWKAWGSPLGFLVSVSLILMQASKNFSDLWLAYWTKNRNTANFTLQAPDASFGLKVYAETTKDNVICILENAITLHGFGECPSDDATELKYSSEQISADSFYLAIYTGIAIINSAMTLIRAFSFAYAGIKAAKFIHNRLLNSVFYSEFSFFDITPLGRIVNRFSSDTYTIDDSLPFILNILLALIVGLIGTLSVTLFAMPWLALLIFPMCPIYFNIQSRYRQSSREVKRLLSTALSPIYTHFTETVQGLPTIRSMRSNNRFCRDFLVKSEENIRAHLTSAASQQWLALRLQMLGAFFIGFAGFVTVITSSHSTSPELAGLVISYALSVTALLSGVLSAVTETEQEFIAVERVHGYSKLNPEVNAKGSDRTLPYGWPCQGVVKFDNVTLKYRPYLQPSLRNISFQTSSCERIGIVGRTGAGKSSLISALLRVAPLETGRITIDSCDISTIPLNTLRSLVALVPQDTFLFSGTIRENLDPRQMHLDSEIWNAISLCLAAPLVQALGGLNAYLDVKGSNVSTGQRQLLCLARALLRKSKIVIIDEGTSNLDSDSENAIQLILRNAFGSSTVLLIAHRLNGLQQVDRILVVDSGEIVEEGKPQDLAKDSESRFYGLLQEQQTNMRLKST